MILSTLLVKKTILWYIDYIYMYIYIYIYIHVYYKQRFVSQVCKPELIQKHIKAAEKMDTKELL